MRPKTGKRRLAPSKESVGEGGLEEPESDGVRMFLSSNFIWMGWKVLILDSIRASSVIKLEMVKLGGEGLLDGRADETEILLVM